MKILTQHHLFLLALTVLLSSSQAEAREFTFHHEHVLGTSLELKISADSAEQARAAEQTALAEIDRLARILSRHDSNSELMRWQSSKTSQKLSADLTAVLTRAERWRQTTHGAFDVRAAAFSRLWKQAALTQQLPSETERRQLAVTLSQAPWKTDDQKDLVRNDSLPLSLDALGKGYILDAVCSKVMQSSPEVSDIVLNIGGDIRKLGRQPLNIAITDPRSTAEGDLPLVTFPASGSLALATSGGYQRYFEIAGRRYSHIIDPRNGFPADAVLSASVLAPNAMDADAAATALTVLGPSTGLALIESLDGFECLLLSQQGTLTVSSGWPAGNHGASVELIAADAAENPKDGLLVDFTLNRPTGGRYRRPYVAVWLEDKDGYPVKTAILWMQTRQPGPRWHRDLTRWYRNDRIRKLAEETDMIGTISSATRGPGKYQARFDGTDNEGKPLPVGKYVLCLEAAREHGTYQIIRKEIELGSQPVKLTPLKENVEFSKVSFQYTPWSSK